jgi:chaperonin GroES
MKLVPLYNKIIVEILKDGEEEVTKGGLYIPNKPKPFYRGKVTGVGCGHYQNAKRIEMDIKEGDIVLFLKNSGFGVQFDESGIMPTHVVLGDTDIYAKEVNE